MIVNKEFSIPAECGSYSIGDALKLAQSLTRNYDKEYSLEEAESIILQAKERAGFSWMTGDTALAVITAYKKSLFKNNFRVSFNRNESPSCEYFLSRDEAKQYAVDIKNEGGEDVAIFEIISKNDAKRRLESEEVCRLYDDGTEGVIESEDDLDDKTEYGICVEVIE